eukprot:gene810-9060_t
MSLQREELIFTDCYCEENIYKLCEKIKKTQPENLKFFNVVFISSEDERVPIWNQNEKNSLTIWDYHVILIFDYKKHTLVYDLSSQLDFPINFKDYVFNSFLLSNYLMDEKSKSKILQMLQNT